MPSLGQLVELVEVADRERVPALPAPLPPEAPSKESIERAQAIVRETMRRLGGRTDAA